MTAPTAAPSPDSATARLAERRQRAVARSITSVSPFYIDRAAGDVIHSVDGREYLDFGSGIAVTSIGHGDPRLLSAISAQAEDFLHTCFMLTPYEGYIAVCEQLNRLTPGDHEKRTALFSTGAEALENAVKIARTATKRQAIVVFDHAYHGRTQLTMTMTSKYAPYKKGFGPFAAEIYRLPMPYPFRWPSGPGNAAAEALDQAETIIRTQIGAENVAAIVIEPIQGEGGFIVPPAGFLPGLRRLADDIGALLVADEVQTGLGRTGAWFATEHEGVVADLVTTGKALASGMPLAAVTGRAEVMDAVHAGGIGGTYAGNPVSCAASLATMRIMEDDALPARASWIGEQFARVLGPVADSCSIVGELRGRGAMQAIEIVQGDGRTPSPTVAADILAACQDAGVLALTCGTFGNVLRFLPPLTITEDNLDRGLATIAQQITTANERCNP